MIAGVLFVNKQNNTSDMNSGKVLTIIYNSDLIFFHIFSKL